jgi:hypothetical protein
MGSEDRHLSVAILEDNVRHLICMFRDVQVMVDADLAALYGVETEVLNQAVKRNIARFPDTYVSSSLKLKRRNWSQIVTGVTTAF